MRKKITSVIIFLIIFELVFPKFSYSQQYSKEYLEKLKNYYCAQAVDFLRRYTLTKLFTKDYYFISKSGILTDNYNINNYILRDINNGSYSIDSKSRTRIYWYQPTYSSSTASRIVIQFIIYGQENLTCEWNGDPKHPATTIPIKLAKITMQYPNMIYLPPSQVKVGTKILEIISEDLKIQETFLPRSTYIYRTSRKVIIPEESDSKYNTYPLSSIIISPSPPNCKKHKSTSWLVIKEVSLDCVTYALAMNGKIGRGYYHEEKSGIDLGSIGIIVGIGLSILGGVLPGLSLITAGVLLNQGFDLTGPLIAYSNSLDDSIKNKTFGTIEEPAGDLKKFKWEWYGGFGLPSTSLPIKEPQQPKEPQSPKETQPTKEPQPSKEPQPTSSTDLSLTQFEIRSFICKNNSYDKSYINDFLSKNSTYLFPPSTTAADEYGTKKEKNQPVLDCFESQVNRPVEFSATGTCFGICPPSKLKIEIKREGNNEKVFEITSPQADSSYPKTLKGEYIFKNDGNYKATACLVDENNNKIPDQNPDNNCTEQEIKVYDYYCLLGFCTRFQNQKTLRIFGTTDSPCRFWKNQACQARYRF